jgi:hypothetical protein
MRPILNSYPLSGTRGRSRREAEAKAEVEEEAEAEAAHPNVSVLLQTPLRAVFSICGRSKPRVQSQVTIIQ